MRPMCRIFIHYFHFETLNVELVNIAGLMCIKEMDEIDLRRADMPFSVPSSTGQEIHLSNKYSKILPDNKSEYIRLALNYRYCIQTLTRHS